MIGKTSRPPIHSADLYDDLVYGVPLTDFRIPDRASPVLKVPAKPMSRHVCPLASGAKRRTRGGLFVAAIL